MTQTQRVLAAFQSAPNHTLTTAQIDSLPFMTNQRARISDLRKLGHVIDCQPIKGTDSSTFKWRGQLYAEVEPAWIGSDTGFQIQAA